MKTMKLKWVPDIFQSFESGILSIILKKGFMIPSIPEDSLTPQLAEVQMKKIVASINNLKKSIDYVEGANNMNSNISFDEDKKCIKYISWSGKEYSLKTSNLFSGEWEFEYPEDTSLGIQALEKKAGVLAG